MEKTTGRLKIKIPSEGILKDVKDDIRRMRKMRNQIEYTLANNPPEHKKKELEFLLELEKQQVEVLGAKYAAFTFLRSLDVHSVALD